MKKWITCIISVVIALTGICGSASAAAVQDQALAAGIWAQTPTNEDQSPAPTDSGYSDDIKLDKARYSAGGASIKVKLPDHLWGASSVIVEILQQETGSIVFHSRPSEASLTIDINLHPGEYWLRARQDTVWNTEQDVNYDKVYACTPFSVDGTSNLFHLTGEAVAEGDLAHPESCMLMGVRLTWDGPADGGPYTLTRIDEKYSDGQTTRIEDIQTNHMIDTDALPGGIYTYIVSDGERTSNPVVLDLTKFPPLEYVGNRNDQVIVLRIGDPYLYSAPDKQSASRPSALTRIKAIDEDDLGVVPMIANSRTLLPVANLVRTMGGTVHWDSRDRLVTIKIWDNTLVIPIDSNTVYLNNESRTFDTPARIEHNRTMVPIRQLELLGCEVNWHPESRSVVICYQGHE